MMEYDPTPGVLSITGVRPRRAEFIGYDRTSRLVWHKRRFTCVDADCAMGSWTEEDVRIAAPRQVLTTRAARWATRQVGSHARSVSEVAKDLGCDWHTVNDTVIAYGEALLELTRTGSAPSPPWASTRCS